jgi:hypothetical protein
VRKTGSHPRVKPEGGHFADHALASALGYEHDAGRSGVARRVA